MCQELFTGTQAPGRRDAKEGGGRGTCGLFMSVHSEPGPGGLSGTCVKVMV